MFNDIDWTKRGNSEKCKPKSEHVKNFAERFSRGHWTFLGPCDEKKWYGTLSYTLDGKLRFHRHRDGGTFQRNWSPSVQEHQCSESWNSERKNEWQGYHTLQCGFSKHRTLVSHNSLSKSAQSRRSSFKLVLRVRSTDSESKGVGFGKVRGKRKRAATLKSVKPQEVNSLVQTPRSDNRASVNRRRECLQRFETLENDIQFTRVCEDATFGTRVSIGTSYKTIADEDDGLEIERQHAENTHFFVKIQIPESMQQFQDKL